MNVWAIQRDVAMEGGHVSHLVATGFLEHANLDLGIANYRHLVAYFGGTIKQYYCTKFPIDETLGQSSTTVARHYANYSNDHRFMDNQQMYTYKLVVEAWHRLLQLDGSPFDPPPSGTSTVEIPTIIDRPNTHCPLQTDCASLFASFMYLVAQTPAQPAILPPPRN
jgi:hypothetical protein